jgi:uncharacterized Zn-finger protein
MKIIAYIAAAILIFFGVLFMWGAFAPDAPDGWLFVGLASVLIGFGLIWFASRRKPTAADGTTNVTVQVDLPANVKMDTMKCKSCGGDLNPQKDIKMVAGAPMVVCPYCGTTYQLTEDPKW